MHAGANVVGMESRRGVGRVNEGVQREREVLGRSFMKRKSGICWFRLPRYWGRDYAAVIGGFDSFVSKWNMHETLSEGIHNNYNNINTAISCVYLRCVQAPTLRSTTACVLRRAES